MRGARADTANGVLRQPWPKINDSNLVEPMRNGLTSKHLVIVADSRQTGMMRGGLCPS